MTTQLTPLQVREEVEKISHSEVQIFSLCVLSFNYVFLQRNEHASKSNLIQVVFCLGAITNWFPASGNERHFNVQS